MKNTSLVIAMLLSFSAQAEIAIIAHPSHGESQISIEDAQKLWLGKSRKHGNAKVSLADQKEDGPVRGEFSEKVLGQSERQVRAHWSKLIFTGQATPPEVVGSDAEMKSWVASQSDRLGYINASAADGSVKVLLRVK